MNRAYLERGQLEVSILPRRTAWLDTGTLDCLKDARSFFHPIQARQGLEEEYSEKAAWRQGLLTDKELGQRGDSLEKSGYCNYPHQLLQIPDASEESS